MHYNHLVESNRILKKFVQDPILAWTEIDASKLHYKRSWYTAVLNLLPLPVRFTQQTTISVLVLTNNDLHLLNIGIDNKLYKSSLVIDRTRIEGVETIKQKNEWQKVVALFHDGKQTKLTIHNYPSLFKYHFGLNPEDANVQDFNEMSEYLLEQL